MKEIRLKARAKINISLDVLGRRDNGYHDVEMIMQTINLHDRLILKKIKSNRIKIKTNLPYLPTDERNLVYKIINFMKAEYKISSGVYVDLKKMIPVAAGMAGGSADAASTIIGMNQLFDLQLDKKTILEIAGKYGSDIPYCVEGGTVLASGLGDELKHLDPFPEMDVLIVKPRFGMSTQTVYQNLNLSGLEKHPDTEGLIRAISNQDIDFITSNLSNVLETVTIKLHPELDDIKSKIRNLGADGVLMSGSGPTVYGLFKDRKIAEKAKKKLRQSKELQFVYLTTIFNRKKG